MQIPANNGLKLQVAYTLYIALTQSICGQNLYNKKIG